MSLDRDSVRKWVIEEAESHKDKVKEDLRNKYIYLKFDCATRIRANYLAINVRYIDDNDKVGGPVPVTKTLAVIDTRSRHSSNMIKEMVGDTMTRFGIKPTNVVCAVTDNAANMVKEEVEFEEGTLNLEELVPHRIEHMRCAVHTLQLAVHDALKEPQVANVIGKLKAVAVEARTPIIDEEVKSMAGKSALLANETRWGSQYVMIQRLLDLKEIIQRIARLGNIGLNLTESEWDQAEKMAKILKKAYDVMLRLQYKDLDPSYFFKNWLSLRMYYQEHGSLLAESLAKHMKRREEELFTNGVLLMGVMLDPTSFDYLSDEQKKLGLTTATNLVLRMRGIIEEDDVQDEEEDYSDVDCVSDEELGAVLKKRRLTSPKEPEVSF